MSTHCLTSKTKPQQAISKSISIKDFEQGTQTCLHCRANASVIANCGEGEGSPSPAAVFAPSWETEWAGCVSAAV